MDRNREDRARGDGAHDGVPVLCRLLRDPQLPSRHASRRRSPHRERESMMSFVAWPRATAYVAARWALRGFTEALRQDLRGTTIKVTLIAAGAVKSPYWQHNQSLDRMPKGNLLLPLLLPEQVAEAIVRSVEKDQQLALLPWGTKLIFAMQRVAPRLVSWLMAKAAAA